MILGSGILRSGGRTAYVMAIDLVGTWGFGVPAGLVTAFVFALPVPYVYFALSLEECLRIGITLAVFRRRRWMRRLSAHADWAKKQKKPGWRTSASRAGHVTGENAGSGAYFMKVSAFICSM